MTQTLKNLLGSLILPPAGLALLGIAGLVLLRQKHKLGISLIVTTILTNLFLAMPIVSNNLLHSLEHDAPLDPTHLPQNRQAIAVMGCGIYQNPPEFPTHIPSDCALGRMSYAAYLHQQTKLPILITGGGSDNVDAKEALVMRDFLEKQWQVPVSWIETDSWNSFESAQNSFLLLKSQGITRIFLVTHTWHMLRSKRAFENAGFTVTAAPTHFTRMPEAILNRFIPHVDAYKNSHTALREYLGMVFYRLAHE